MSTAPPPSGNGTVADRYRPSADGRSLSAGRCATCGEIAWPMPARCPTCGSSEVSGEALPRHGSVETWTQVWVPVPGVDCPYVIGRVRLGDCQVYGRIDVPDGTEPRTGATVTVRTTTDGPDGVIAPYRLVIEG